MKGTRSGDMDRLEDLLKQAETKIPAPVELWNPPYCGDIGLSILRDGQWHYQNSPIPRPALVKLFASVLRRDEDGRYFLVTPAEKIDIAVADVPFIAVEMHVSGHGCSQSLLFHTNVDDVVSCGRDHPLRFMVSKADQGLKPYVRVRGRLDALVSRALVYDLVELACEGPDDKGLGVWSGGEFFPLPNA